ncbi:MAG: DUF1834 family protein [Reyranella sp.]|nr:DUF1834 family protein [Reyranella sp.]
MTAPLFPFAAIETAMIARLRAASAADVGGNPLLGYRLRQVESYQGQLNGGPKRVVEVVREVPAVWVCFEKATPDRGSGLWAGSFVAVCVARNARNEQAARHGAGAGAVGVYQIARDVAGLLDGQTFGVEHATAAECTTIDAPFNAEFENTRAAIMLLTFELKWDPDGAAPPVLPAEPQGALHPAGMFEHFNVDWDIPVFTEPKPAIPVADPTKRDARDTILPEQ